MTERMIINLVYALKRPYHKKAKFIMNDATIAALRKLKDENGAAFFTGWRTGQTIWV